MLPDWMAGKPGGCGNNRRQPNPGCSGYPNTVPGSFELPRKSQNDFPRAFVYKAAVLIGFINLVS